jgi:hypothetical protein
VKQGLVHELVNAKLIVVNDVGGANDANLDACISLIRVKVDAHGDVGAFSAMPLACIPNSSPSQVRFKESTPMSRSYDLFYEGRRKRHPRALRFDCDLKLRPWHPLR